MKARLILANRPEISIPALADALRANLAGFATVSPPQKKDGAIGIGVNRSIVNIGLSNQPIAWNLDEVLSRSGMWTNDKAHVQSHNSQLYFSVSGPDDPRSQALYLTRAIVASMDQLPMAIAVYWESAGQLIPAIGFRAAAGDEAQQGAIWVSVQTADHGRKSSLGCTRGMSAIGQREIETRNANESAEELAARLYGLVHYLIKNGPIMKDGETFGQTSKEKILVRYEAQSTFGNRCEIMNLDFGNTQVALPKSVTQTTADQNTAMQNTAIQLPAGSQIGTAPGKVSVPVLNAHAKRKSVMPLVLFGLVGLVLVAGAGFLVTKMKGNFAKSDPETSEAESPSGQIENKSFFDKRLDEIDLTLAERDNGVSHGNSDSAREFARDFVSLYSMRRDAVLRSKGKGDLLQSGDLKANCDIYSEDKTALMVVKDPVWNDIPEPVQKELVKVMWAVGYELARQATLDNLIIGNRHHSDYSEAIVGKVAQQQVFVPTRTGSTRAALSGFLQDVVVSKTIDKAVELNQVSNEQPAGKLTYSMRGKTLGYRGEMTSTTQGESWKAELIVQMVPQGGESFSLGGHAKWSTSGQPGNSYDDAVQGDVRINSKGELQEYDAESCLPIAGLPIGLLPIAELPFSEDTLIWQTSAEGQFSRYMVFADGEFLRNDWHAQYKELKTNRRNQGKLALQFRHEESYLLRETRKYKITGVQNGKVFITCEALLDIPPAQNFKHEIKFTANYVFNKLQNVVEKVTVKGTVTEDDGSSSDFQVNINLMTAHELAIREKNQKEEKKKQQEEETRIAQQKIEERVQKEKQRVEEKIARSEARKKRDRERAEKDARENDWTSAAVVSRLTSGDKNQVREAFNGMRANKIKPPDQIVSDALMDLLENDQDNIPFWGVSVCQDWLTADEHGESLLELLPDSEDNAFRIIAELVREMDVPGRADALVKAMENNPSTWVRSEINRLEVEHETAFHDLLETSENADALRTALFWMVSKGTKRSITALKKFARRNDDRSLQSTVDSAIRIIEMKSRMRRR